MAGQRATISGADFSSAAFMSSLRAAVGALEIKTTQGLWTLAVKIQNNARLLSPVDTGRLRSSINASRGADATGPFVDIGTNVQYAAHVEFGTVNMPAQPYLRPALAAAVGYGGLTIARGAR